MNAFDYHRATDRASARQAWQGDARYLAGGQSLLPAMRLGFAAPERLVDLAGVADLAFVRVDTGVLTIGAMTTHAAVAASPEVARTIPALSELAHGIGDAQVRAAGTLGGSIANADPAACYPAALLGLGANVLTDRRSIAAEDFFKGLFETALQPGELVTAVEFPIPQRAAYAKLRQPASRFAMVGVFVAQGRAGLRVAVTGTRASVYREPALEAALATHFTAAAAAAVVLPADELNSDLHASAAYRAAMIPVMAGRAVAAALAR